MSQLEDTIRAAAGLLTEAELAAPILVGVSGGGDSLALLHLLHAWAGDTGAALEVVHVHHGLRPEADAAADHVRRLGESLHLPVTVARVDVAAVRRRRRAGLEDAARQARYRAFGELAAERRARVLALAHHADDQAETVLLHLFRGAGLGGLRGMPPVRRGLHLPADGGRRAMPLPTLWRPLLDAPRALLAAYRGGLGLRVIEDSSNEDTSLRRNAIRREVLPRIERSYPGAAGAIARGARLLADDDELIESLVERRWREIVTPEEGVLVLDRAAFRDEPRAVRRRVLRRSWRFFRGSTDGLGAEPVEAACQAIAAGRTGARHALPKGIAVQVERATAFIGETGGLDERLRARAGLPLATIVGETPVRAGLAVPCAGGWRIEAAREWKEGERGAAPTRGPLARHIPLGPPDEWTLRNWQPGDRVSLPDGLGSRKLQDWLVDQRVPGYLRHHLVLLTRGGWVAWVAGLAAFPNPDEPASASGAVRPGILVRAVRACSTAGVAGGQ